MAFGNKLELSLAGIPFPKPLGIVDGTSLLLFFARVYEQKNCVVGPLEGACRCCRRRCIVFRRLGSVATWLARDIRVVPAPARLAGGITPVPARLVCDNRLVATWLARGNRLVCNYLIANPGHTHTHKIRRNKQKYPEDYSNCTLDSCRLQKARVLRQLLNCENTHRLRPKRAHHECFQSALQYYASLEAGGRTRNTCTCCKW